MGRVATGACDVRIRRLRAMRLGGKVLFCIGEGLVDLGWSWCRGYFVSVRAKWYVGVHVGCAYKGPRGGGGLLFVYLRRSQESGSHFEYILQFHTSNIDQNPTSKISFPTN